MKMAKLLIDQINNIKWTFYLIKQINRFKRANLKLLRFQAINMVGLKISLTGLINWRKNIYKDKIYKRMIKINKFFFKELRINMNYKKKEFFQI